MRELEDVAIGFHRACTRAETRYAFVGGIAVMAWGQPRATVDVDALVLLERERLTKLVTSFQEEGFDVEPWELEAALAEGSHVTLFDPESAYHVDMKPAVRPEERAEIHRVQTVTFHGEGLAFAAPEDVIVFKLVFGTPQDRQDARSVLARQWTRLDHEALKERARDQGVAEELKALSAEVRSALDDG